jgi:hypothetical protein
VKAQESVAQRGVKIKEGKEGKEGKERAVWKNKSIQGSARDVILVDGSALQIE